MTEFGCEFTYLWESLQKPFEHIFEILCKIFPNVNVFTFSKYQVRRGREWNETLHHAATTNSHILKKNRILQKQRYDPT